MIRTITIVCLSLVSAHAVASTAPSTSEIRVFIPEVRMTEGARTQAGEAALDSVIAETISKDDRFSALTTSEVQALLSQQAREQMMGCEGLGCSAQIARLASVDLLLQMEIGYFAKRFVLNASLLSPSEGRALKRLSSSVSNADALEKTISALARRLISQDSVEESTSQEEDAAQNEIEGRLLVFISNADTTLLDSAGQASIEQRVAETIVKDTQLQVTASSELKALLQDAALRQNLGTGDISAIETIAKASKADLLVSLNIGKAGEQIVVAASLIDVATSAIVARSSLLLPNATLLGAACEVVAQGLFGREVALPTPQIAPNRFETTISELAESVAKHFVPHQKSVLSRLGLLELRNYGGQAQARKMGATVSDSLRSALGERGLPLVKKERLADLKNLGSGAEPSPQEVAQFIGATLLIQGEVTEIGKDFLIALHLVPQAADQPTITLHRFIPMGTPDLFALKQELVHRSRAGAVFRSVIPGWGQFYNGPAHGTKGILVLGGVAAGLITTAVFGVMRQDILDDIYIYENDANMRLALGCTAGNTAVCDEKVRSLSSDADAMKQNALISAGLAGVVYLYGFIDAAIYGGSYQE